MNWLHLYRSSMGFKAVEGQFVECTAYCSYFEKPWFIAVAFDESENSVRQSMVLSLLLLLLLAYLNFLDDWFFDLKEFENLEYLFCAILNEAAVQIFKHSVIFKFNLNRKFDFDFDSYFKFIHEEDLQINLVSICTVTIKKEFDYQSIDCYFIIFAFNQQNWRN